MKKFVVCLVVLLAVSASFAVTANVPDGYTGLWQFASSANKTVATVGTNMVLGGDSGAWMTGPATQIGTVEYPTALQDNGVVQDSEWGYFQFYHGIAPNGGGSYVNRYTIMMDYCQTSDLSQWNGLFQTAADAHGNDADLFTDGAGHIGIGDVGYSTSTYDASKWHRIVLSVDTSSTFDVYVDGVQFLDGGATGLDGRFSLNNNFMLLADNSWNELGWGLLGNVATWNRALTAAEVTPMGGWIGGAATPTPLIIPEPATIAVLALGGLLIRRKK